MLDISDLAFDYFEEPLFEEINFHLSQGDLLHLKGANGSGKTTLLKLIAGLYRPHQGRICYFGQDVNHNLSSYQADLCFVGHKTGINPYLTVKENCLFDLHNHQQNLDELLGVFNLSSHEDELCSVLSAGQKRQIGLLRLWMTKAKLWLLDEPLVALDSEALAELMLKIEQHRDLGGAVILTSHQQLPLAKSHYQEYQLR